MRSTMPDFPLTLQHFLWRSTTLFPRKEIVTRREGGRHRYTYADFGRRVAQLAHALRELGIAHGDRVGTLAWNNYRHLELYFAVPCSGAVLHTLNPRLFPEHLEFVINDAEDKVIFVDASIVPALQRVAKNLTSVKQFVVMADGPSPDGQLTPAASYEELIGGRPTDYDWPDLDERDAAAMCYTSGTTGKPKGVVYSHRSSVLHSFGIAIGGGIGLHGSALPAGLYDGLTRHGIDTNQGWGMTETSPVAAVAAMKSYIPESDRKQVRLKAGLPIAGVELRLADVESGEPVPWDGKSVGEIQVRGPWVTASYYRGVDPERFTRDGWLRTGDVANVDPEGYAQFVDRTKDLVKSGGEWISSVELESAIMGHPKVLEAAVIGVPHPKWQERPVAYVVAKPEFKGAVTQDEILDYLRPLVAKWWLPDEVRFIDEIPKTSVGKFDKKVLREQARQTPAIVRPSE